MFSEYIISSRCEVYHIHYRLRQILAIFFTDTKEIVNRKCFICGMLTNTSHLIEFDLSKNIPILPNSSLKPKSYLKIGLG